MGVTSDSNQVQLGAILESTWGTTPSNPAFQTLRISGMPGFGRESRHVESDEIRSDRNVTDNVLVDFDVSGECSFNMSYGCLDIPLAGVLFNSWSTDLTDIENVVSDTPISGVAGATETITCGNHAILANHLVYLTGFGVSANNCLTRVASVITNTSITVIADLTDEETIPIGARIRVCGFAGASGKISAVTADGNALTSTDGPDFTTFGIDAGDWVKIGGTATGTYFATAATNGWARVSTVAAARLSFDIVPTGFTADDGSGKQIQVFLGEKITNSTTKNSYTLEQIFWDQSPDELYGVHTGCVFNTLSFEINLNDFVKGTWSFMGKSSTYSTTRTSGGSSVDAPTSNIFNATSDIGSLAISSTQIGDPNYVLKATININNSLRSQKAVANLGPVGIGAGRCHVGGSIQTYFGNKTYLDYVVADNELDYNVRLSDADCQVFSIDLPKVKLSGGKPDVPGADSDVTVEFPFLAAMHETLNYTIKIQQFPYVAGA